MFHLGYLWSCACMLKKICFERIVSSQVNHFVPRELFRALSVNTEDETPETYSVYMWVRRETFWELVERELSSACSWIAVIMRGGFFLGLRRTSSRKTFILKEKKTNDKLWKSYWTKATRLKANLAKNKFDLKKTQDWKRHLARERQNLRTHRLIDKIWMANTGKKNKFETLSKT